MKDAKRWLPGALISITAIAAILYFVDLQRLWEAIQSANYGLLAISVAMGVVWLAMRAVVWRTILQEKASYRDSFLTICEGYFLNNIMPFRLGEIGRAFLLARKSELNFMEVFPTIVIERALDLVFSAAILLSAIPFVVKTSGAETISVIIGVVVVLGLIVLYILARNSAWTIHQVERFPALHKVAAPFLAGLSSLTDGRRFLLILVLMAINWLWAIFQFFLTIKAFFPAAAFPWALFGIGAAAFGGAVPSAPGAVGTYEAALGGALTLVSSDEARSVAVAITAHLFNYLITGALGIYALSTEGETLSSIYRQLRRRQEEKPVEIDPQP
jgi:uncharacterized protein (TIRG00374 family)